MITWFTLVGVGAQLCFGARMLVQWLLSEKAKAIANPALFWWLSLMGAFLMTWYGYLRTDLAIILAQLIGYYVYVYNLKLKGQLSFKGWGLFALPLIMLMPLIFLALQASNLESLLDSFSQSSSDIGLGWLLFGSCSYFLFTMRYLYQSWISHKEGKSLLPLPFWYISIIAALCVQIYGIYREDIVLIVSQMGGMIVYARNIILGRRTLKAKHEA